MGEIDRRQTRVYDLVLDEVQTNTGTQWTVIAIWPDGRRVRSKPTKSLQEANLLMDHYERHGRFP